MFPFSRTRMIIRIPLRYKATGYGAAIDNLRRITDATDLPVTVDLESGYGDTPEKVGETVAQAASLRFSATGRSRPDNTRLNQNTNTWYLADLNCTVVKKDPLTLKVLAGNKYFVSSQTGGTAYYTGPNLDGQTLTVDMNRLGPETLRLDFGNALQMAGAKAEAQASLNPLGGPLPVISSLTVRRTEPLPRQAVTPPKKRKTK